MYVQPEPSDWRCTRRGDAEEMLEEAEAALKIQAAHRGKVARREVNARRQQSQREAEEQRAALRIQSAWRAALDCWLIISKRHQAATRILVRHLEFVFFWSGQNRRSNYLPPASPHAPNWNVPT